MFAVFPKLCFSALFHPYSSLLSDIGLSRTAFERAYGPTAGTAQSASSGATAAAGGAGADSASAPGKRVAFECPDCRAQKEPRPCVAPARNAPPPVGDRAPAAQIEELSSSSSSSSSAMAAVASASSASAESSDAPAAAAALLSSVEWHALAARLLDTLMAAAGADDFSVVVDPVAFGVPDYWAYVHRPMDLGTVRANVAKGAYSAPWQVAEVCARVSVGL
jgi:hypothetical protein